MISLIHNDMISIVFAFHKIAIKNHLKKTIVHASELVFHFKFILKPKLIYIL